ncbi:MAG: DUF4174 domain-containing protein [Paracoccaceae bacterium]
MKILLCIAFAAMAPLTAAATEAPGADSPLEAWQADPTAVLDARDVNLDDFKWLARPVVVFADTPADPRFKEQMNLLAERPEQLVERDVVILTDTDPTAESAARERLRPRGFMLVVMGKDGALAFRKPTPRDVREISRSIDKMPMRQEEMRENK